MSKILKLRMLSDEAESFIRNYEVPENIDLMELHYFICDNLKYDSSNFSSFFASNEQWEKLQEYTLDDMMDDDEEQVIALPMEGTLLKDIIASGASRMIFMFDIFAARSMFLEIKGVAEADSSKSYPLLISGEGDAPSQTDAEGLLFDESPFDEMMSDFSDFEDSEEEGYSDDM